MIDKSRMDEGFYDSLCGLAAALGVCDPDDEADAGHFGEVLEDFCEKWGMDEASATEQAIMMLEDRQNPPLGDLEVS